MIIFVGFILYVPLSSTAVRLLLDLGFIIINYLVRIQSGSIGQAWIATPGW
jgi:hypothetical protein